MVYSILTLSLIGLILIFWLIKLICRCFFRPFCQWKEQNNPSGPSKEATILSVKKLKEGKAPLLELQLLFENFSGYPIHRSIRLWDKSPQLNRFKKDGSVRIILDPAKKPNEPYTLRAQKSQVSLGFLLLGSLLTIAYVAGCYFLMGEAISRVSLSPEYYENLFSSDSKTTETFFIISLTLVFLYFLFKKLGLLSTKESKSQNWDLLYYGLGTMATIKSYSDTGVLINDNPMVEFNYTFLDQTGQIHEGSDEKLVGKLEIINLPDINELEVLYLPNNPSISRLAENLQEQSFSNHIRGLFLFVLLIFSIFFIVSFCQDIF
ncbi:hypothetical protein [Flagellimonas iocasae]|uniref:RING-type E3 ubiquitin transferase n=1 Tax=Flagellimonas iocasae TaxID=2055905 RepID=A0ABW4XYQ7_9FLAO